MKNTASRAGLSIFLGVVFSAIASTAIAQASPPHSFRISGAAEMSCAAVLRATQSMEGQRELGQWIGGYVTGYNYYETSHQVRPPEDAETNAFFAGYCRKNPESNLVAAAAVLVEQLGGKVAEHPYRHWANDSVEARPGTR